MTNYRFGSTRVADLAADYSGEDYSLVGFAIEEYSYHNRDELCWAVPAWDERGRGDLCGDLPCGAFATREEAETALRNALVEA